MNMKKILILFFVLCSFASFGQNTNEDAGISLGDTLPIFDRFSHVEGYTFKTDCCGTFMSDGADWVNISEQTGAAFELITDNTLSYLNSVLGVDTNLIATKQDIPILFTAVDGSNVTNTTEDIFRAGRIGFGNIGNTLDGEFEVGIDGNRSFFVRGEGATAASLVFTNAAFSGNLRYFTSGVLELQTGGAVFRIRPDAYSYGMRKGLSIGLPLPDVGINLHVSADRDVRFENYEGGINGRDDSSSNTNYKAYNFLYTSEPDASGNDLGRLLCAPFSRGLVYNSVFADTIPLQDNIERLSSNINTSESLADFRYKGELVYVQVLEVASLTDATTQGFSPITDYNELVKLDLKFDYSGGEKAGGADHLITASTSVNNIDVVRSFVNSAGNPTVENNAGETITNVELTIFYTK